MSNADFFLKKALGEDFFDALSKVELWKPGTKSTLDHEEMKTALQIVPRTVIALLIRELVPMKIGETKEIELPGISSAGPHPEGSRSMIRATKHERDVYSGEIEEDNKMVVDFKLRSLPGVGLVIMSAFELYDMDNLIGGADANEQLAPDAAPIAPEAGSIAPQPLPLLEDADMKIQHLIDERLALHELIGKVVDKKIMEKEAIHELVLAKITEALKLVNEKVNAVSNDVKHVDLKLDGARALAFSAWKKAHTKKRPLDEFLEKKKKTREFSIYLTKGESVSCPDCGKNIFDGNGYSGCICMGENMNSKIYLKKSENGIKIRFPKSWTYDNIEMLLEILRNRE